MANLNLLAAQKAKAANAQTGALKYIKIAQNNAGEYYFTQLFVKKR